ncbi:MAG: hypothetical protein JO328_18560 [Hyphomicrobiales bacterium]|nr:hypothetical protein [Hyphomicrobiales bacterium]MBV8825889.1 hypothetical protein [Hyphomicrobiales bacterium]MBV9429343.1 hypothetical protein [Bradyrhizobiaceae bacterium]
MRSLAIPAIVAIMLGIGNVPAGALTRADRSGIKTGAGDVTLVGSSKRRAHYDVRVPRYGYQARVPRQYRGFQDPGYAYHGNINGCAVDLGYGRWESCNVGR